MQGERERICRFCKKLLNPPEEKIVPVVSVFFKQRTDWGFWSRECGFACRS